ncbi:hypothetical protein BHM03_00001264 [Ensete ventricosum]|uniref:H(+)-exporting diphosphatase n=1 Tax=Ensete ventricosum TaxID=4639 RepID=A0A445M928_ENSVE|nr:hypothetical protein BHM03_00001264 [Ensete ventricosum]
MSYSYNYLLGQEISSLPISTSRYILQGIADNVRDVSEMTSDLFGSYAESSCAALVVASISSVGVNHDFPAMCYPLLISSMGIEVCLITTLFATDGWYCNYQLDTLPSTFTIFSFGVTRSRSKAGWYHVPFISLNAATSVIFKLALGNKSVIIPIFATAVSIFVRFSLAAMYGIAVAALGMPSTIATGLAIDAYGNEPQDSGENRCT